MYTGNMIVTGKRIEEELFGKAVDGNKIPQYEPYTKALANIKTMPSNSHPKSPIKDFARLLCLEVIKQSSSQDTKFYTAVGSAFDRWHGVDAVIELATEAGKQIIVTIDVTKKAAKPDGKADIIFTVPEDGLPDYPKVIRDSYDQYDKNEFCKHINLLAGEVVKVIKQKLSLAN